MKDLLLNKPLLLSTLHDLEMKSHALRLSGEKSQNKTRVISVSGQSEQSLPPDRVKLLVVIKSVKDNLNEARHSVDRRFDYVFQTLRKHRVPVILYLCNSIVFHKFEFMRISLNACVFWGLQEANIVVSKTSNRVGDKFELIAELASTFDNIPRFQLIYNHLNEKLDKSIVIHQPHFFHTPSRLDAIR